MQTLGGQPTIMPYKIYILLRGQVVACLLQNQDVLGFNLSLEVLCSLPFRITVNALTKHYLSSSTVTHLHGCLYLSVLSFDGLVLLLQGERLWTPGTELHNAVCVLFIFYMEQWCNL